MQTKQVVIKSVTDAIDENIVATSKAVLSNLALARSILNVVGLTSGTTLYPFTDIPAYNATSFIIKGLVIPKTIDITALDLTDETFEDISPVVGVNSCMSTLMGQLIAKKIEQKFVTDLRADVSIATTGTVTWAGIAAAVVSLTPSVYNTEGEITIGVSLAKALELNFDANYENALKIVGTKINVVISEYLADTEMVVMHTHGVAGGFKLRTLEFDREGASNQTALIGGYSYGYAWDSKYVKFITVA